MATFYSSSSKLRRNLKYVSSSLAGAVANEEYFVEIKAENVASRF